MRNANTSGIICLHELKDTMLEFDNKTTPNRMLDTMHVLEYTA